MAAISESQLWKKRLGDWVLNPYIGCEHGCLHCYCPAMPGVKFFNDHRPQTDGAADRDAFVAEQYSLSLKHAVHPVAFPASHESGFDSGSNRFIPWPDTSRRWAKHLNAEQTAWLDQSLPAKGTVAAA